MILKTRMNYGRWIVDCPNCNGAEIAVIGKKFMCTSCYPGLMATAYQQSTDGLFRPVPDKVRRGKTMLEIRKNKEEYDIEWPKEKDAIERLLRVRKTENSNWYPGETLEILRQENKINGLPY